MQNIFIAKATEDDIPYIMDVFSKAKNFMKENGNPNQWDDSYPSEALIKEDILKSQFYVVKEDGIVHACFAFIIGDDPTYKAIEGAWLSSSVYGTIHRIASDSKIKGVFERIVNFCLTKNPHLRIDTHKDNLVMKHLITKYGFKECGIIHLLRNNETRIAYERL